MKLKQLPINFVKMSGTGNDFIIIDHRTPLIHPKEMSKFARLICRRKFSVGADGLILIENSKVADFRWQFFNADGSVAEMCGNGARCVARFAYLHGIAPARMSFETIAGIIEASVVETKVSVKMTKPKDFKLKQLIEVNGQSFAVHSVDTGVPHAVVLVDDIDRFDVQQFGSLLRHHNAFKPNGTNVNFIGEQNGNFKVRTYERGVEAETQACGTGAVAAALILSLEGKSVSPVEMITSGDDRLTISFDLNTALLNADNVFLKGAANIIYKGELTDEALFEGKALIFVKT
jgi:diaminopimelate epimerase